MSVFKYWKEESYVNLEQCYEHDFKHWNIDQFVND